MTKQLKRLNIKPEYSLVPIPKSGHRFINIPPRKKITYMVYLHQDIYKTRTFKKLTDALCHKYIRILKYKANIGI
jgi:hypothetical protein